MSGRRSTTAVLAVVLAGLLASCTSTVAGQAQPAADAQPAKQAPAADDPCGLLTPEQATGLGYQAKGTAQPAEPDRLIPASCSWQPAEEDSELEGVDVVYSTDIAMSEYFGSKPVSEDTVIGGLHWLKHGESAIGGESSCGLTVELGEFSFVNVSTMDFSEPIDPCPEVLAAVPQVAAALPGGEPAPVPTHQPEPKPFDGVEPCDLLTPEQLGQAGAQPQGRQTGRDADSSGSPGCEWPAASPEFEEIYLAFADLPFDDAVYPDEVKIEDLDVAGRKWGIYGDTTESQANTLCSALLSAGPKASVRITAGNLVDPAKKCDGVKKVAQFITEKLPAS